MAADYSAFDFEFEDEDKDDDETVDAGALIVQPEALAAELLGEDDRVPSPA